MRDLYRLAKILPEDQQEQLFTPTVKEFNNLFKALFIGFYDEDAARKNDDEHPDEKPQFTKERLQRMLRLCEYAIWRIGSYDNALAIAKDSYEVFRKGGFKEHYDSILGAKAILVEAENKTKK